MNCASPYPLRLGLSSPLNSNASICANKVHRGEALGAPLLLVARLHRVGTAAELRAPAEARRVRRLRTGALGGDDADPVLAKDVGAFAHGWTRRTCSDARTRDFTIYAV